MFNKYFGLQGQSTFNGNFYIYGKLGEGENSRNFIGAQVDASNIVKPVSGFLNSSAKGRAAYFKTLSNHAFRVPVAYGFDSLKSDWTGAGSIRPEYCGADTESAEITNCTNIIKPEDIASIEILLEQVHSNITQDHDKLKYFLILQNINKSNQKNPLVNL